MAYSILSSLDSFQIISHVFIIYWKLDHMNCTFLKKLILIQFLTLKLENQTMVTCFMAHLFVNVAIIFFLFLH